jgi:hypothetical protein
MMLSLLKIYLEYTVYTYICMVLANPSHIQRASTALANPDCCPKDEETNTSTHKKQE